VQGILPRSYQVKDRNVHVGVSLKHSDFGAGVLGVNFFLNDNAFNLISKRGLRRVHRGRRLATGHSSRTENILNEDTRKVASTIPPLVQAHLDKENLEATMAEIELSMDSLIDPDKVADILQALRLTDDEMTRGVDAFRTAGALPSNYTKYRLACTIAWLASAEPDTERKLDLMEIAGGLVLPEK
jgi:hypothetical protein